MKNTTRGDALIERICRGGTDDDANQLLVELYKGYPVANLRQLLSSEHEEAVRAAAWLISELGHLATPLMTDIASLLQHPMRYVRFFALDAVLAVASPAHGQTIADAIGLIDDEDHAVRWKAMQFLSRATAEQLRASVRRTTDIGRARLVKWLLDNISVDRVEDIVTAIDSMDPSRRRFGAAAAARIAHQTRAPLEHAAQSADHEVNSFARSILQRSD